MYKVLPAESVAKCKYKVIKKQKSYLEALPVVLKACGANLRKTALLQRILADGFCSPYLRAVIISFDACSMATIDSRLSSKPHYQI